MQERYKYVLIILYRVFENLLLKKLRYRLSTNIEIKCPFIKCLTASHARALSVRIDYLIQNVRKSAPIESTLPFFDKHWDEMSLHKISYSTWILSRNFINLTLKWEVTDSVSFVVLWHLLFIVLVTVSFFLYCAFIVPVLCYVNRGFSVLFPEL
jgi:hypothetical protein